MAHTPGPWGIGRGADGSPLVMVPVHESEGSGFGVAHINRIPRMSSVQGDMDDNARLIAAAPDLLEALKHCLGWIDAWSPPFVEDGEWPEYRAAFDAAIAKAEGR